MKQKLRQQKAHQASVQTPPARKRKQLPGWLLPVAYGVVIALVSWYFLYVCNADVMYFLQDRGWWNSTEMFWNECMRLPGGVLSWTGAFMTQFFYYPALGCCLLIGLWLLSFWLAKRLFGIANEWSFLLFIPIAALLCCIIQQGYWVYIQPYIDFTFFHSLGFLTALLLASLPYGKLPLNEHLQNATAVALIVIVAAAGYYPLGIYALLASAMIGMRLLTRHPAWGLVALVTVVLTIWLVPLLEAADSMLIRPNELWLCGLHRYEYKQIIDSSMEWPQYALLLSALLIPLLAKVKGAGKLLVSQGAMLVTFAAIIAALYSRNFSDYNFHAELRMQRAVDEQNWNDVLREARKAKEPVTRQMVLFRDIALLNNGSLNESRYTYNNKSISQTAIADSIRLRMSDMSGELIYYNFGETNFAIRRAIERCMHTGYSYHTMRLLTNSAIVNGEFDNARKYLRLMSKSLFHKQWAQETETYLGDTTRIAASNRYRIPMTLYKNGSELVGTDEEYVESTLMKKWMYTDTMDPDAQAFALSCAMQMREPTVFWAQVQRYFVIHDGGRFPTHVQEAMLFYYYELKSQGVNLSVVKFDDRILQRYQDFFAQLKDVSGKGMNEEQIGNALRPMFGDTYMWDYCVLRQIETN